jgi:hypothetical protein
MDLLFLNVYAVSRHYGGREEGGWWYNRGEPLASVPLRARRVRGHGDCCAQCNRAKHSLKLDPAERIPFCRYLPENYDQAVEDLARDLAYGLRGARWSDLTDLEQLSYESQAIAQIEQNSPEVYHLVVRDLFEEARKRKELQELFADQARGDIYSVNGGVEIQVMVEESLAAPWPTERPTYS